MRLVLYVSDFPDLVSSFPLYRLIAFFNLSFATGDNYWYFQCVCFSDCCPSVLIFLLAPVFISFTSCAANTSMVLNLGSCYVNFMWFVTFEFNYMHLHNTYICNQPPINFFISINYNSIPGRNPPWHEGTSSLFRVEVWFPFIHLPILQDVFFNSGIGNC